MKRLTISISQELKDRLDQNPQVNWPEVAKQGIKKRIGKLLELRARGEL